MRKIITITLLLFISSLYGQDTLKVKAYDGLGHYNFLTFKVDNEVYLKIPDSIENKKEVLREKLFLKLLKVKNKMKYPVSYSPIYDNEISRIFYSDYSQEIIAIFPNKAKNKLGNYVIDNSSIHLYPDEYEKRKEIESIQRNMERSIRIFNYSRIVYSSNPLNNSDVGIVIYDDGTFNEHKLGSLNDVLILFENCKTYSSSDMYTISKGHFDRAVVVFKGSSSKVYITPYLRKTVIKAIKKFK